MSDTTVLDLAHMAMEAAPEDDTARLRFFERVADSELFLLLDADAGTLDGVPVAAMGEEPEAEAAVTRRAGVVLAVLHADCLPVVLCAEDGAVLGAAHAGWRGLAAGVGKSFVSMGLTRHARFFISKIAFAKSYQLVTPSLA